MTSTKERARKVSDLRRRRKCDAKAAGVDVTDPDALRAYLDAKFAMLCERLRQPKGSNDQ